MTMTVGARSLDNEERSNFRDYMSLLSLSVDASMTRKEVMAVACHQSAGTGASVTYWNASSRQLRQ